MFSHVKTGLTGFWEEHNRDKVPFPSHHINDSCQQRDITADVALELALGSICQVFHCKVTFLSIFPYSLEERHYVQPMFKQWGLMFHLLEGECLHKLCDLFLKYFDSSAWEICYIYLSIHHVSIDRSLCGQMQQHQTLPVCPLSSLPDPQCLQFGQDSRGRQETQVSLTRGLAPLWPLYLVHG